MYEAFCEESISTENPHRQRRSVQVQLTRHTDYGLRMLMYLALESPSTATVGQVAGALELSSHHLMKVAQELRKHGFVEAHRGRSGGLGLAKEPEDVVLGDVVRALESLLVVECFDAERNQCVLTPACAVQGALSKAVEAFLEVLDGYTLADLVRRPKKLRPLVGLAAVGQR